MWIAVVPEYPGGGGYWPNEYSEHSITMMTEQRKFNLSFTPAKIQIPVSDTYTDGKSNIIITFAMSIILYVLFGIPDFAVLLSNDSGRIVPCVFVHWLFNRQIFV